ncbi:hypothetical protein MPSEU_001048800 [Mayamaea pseudoterrestris]|nr:hypothetical protein MPSEU_001048800 [Mayamaea pseudoterrestris]
MSLRIVSSKLVNRAPQRPVQKRTFLDWMTNYPDRINELKRHYQAGGRSIFTWQKQPGDKLTNLIGAGLVTIGLFQAIPGYYHLATGTGKKD